MEPTEVFAGSTWAWNVVVPAHSAADGWSIEYIFTNATTAFTIEDDGTATANTYAINVDAATTAGFTAGDYNWQLFAINGAERIYIDTGPTTVNPDISAGNVPFDARSHAKKTLDAIEAMIQGKATRDQQSYSVAGRSLSRYTFEDLETFRRKYLAEYEQELVEESIAAGKGNPNTIKTTFRRP